MSVWPEKQKLQPLDEPAIVMTRFNDWPQYHPELIDTILRLREDPAFGGDRFPGGCGLKVRDIPRWKNAGADLLHARALELFRRVTGHQNAVVDDSWASLYETGDYCMPHSHLRAAGSIVYLLDPGDGADDPVSGKLCFCDPRIASCCRVKPGHMTNLLIPDMQPGSMIVFPASAVHAVAPYQGKRPRITLSWNIAPQAVAGKPARLTSAPPAAQ